MSALHIRAAARLRDNPLFGFLDEAGQSEAARTAVEAEGGDGADAITVTMALMAATSINTLEVHQKAHEFQERKAAYPPEYTEPGHDARPRSAAPKLRGNNPTHVRTDGLDQPAFLERLKAMTGWSNGEIGTIIGKSTPTVQALCSGRIAKALSPEERQALRTALQSMVDRFQGLQAELA